MRKPCFGEYSSLYFHFPRDALTGIVNFRSKEQMWDSYPDDIQKWLATRTFDNLVFADFWELKAEELWAMGYRKLIIRTDDGSVSIALTTSQRCQKIPKCCQLIRPLFA